MKILQSIIETLENQNTRFALEYYGRDDYGTCWDIKSVLENRELNFEGRTKNANNKYVLWDFNENV